MEGREEGNAGRGLSLGDKHVGKDTAARGRAKIRKFGTVASPTNIQRLTG